MAGPGEQAAPRGGVGPGSGQREGAREPLPGGRRNVLQRGEQGRARRGRRAAPCIRTVEDRLPGGVGRGSSEGPSSWPDRGLEPQPAHGMSRPPPGAEPASTRRRTAAQRPGPPPEREPALAAAARCTHDPPWLHPSPPTRSLPSGAWRSTTSSPTAWTRPARSPHRRRGASGPAEPGVRLAAGAWRRQPPRRARPHPRVPGGGEHLQVRADGGPRAARRRACDWLVPTFEVSRITKEVERAGASADVHGWDEHEHPFAPLAARLRAHGSDRLWIEPDVLQVRGPHARVRGQDRILAADRLVQDLRGPKDVHEVALLRQANEPRSAPSDSSRSAWRKARPASSSPRCHLGPAPHGPEGASWTSR